VELSQPEIRVLGCLVEKQRTTPDAYPLTLNSLRLACNQSTNRDPVVDWDEATVREAAQKLGRRGLARFTSGHGSRAAKYRHLLPEALEVAQDELALLAVLMLRGAQTPGELRARAGRLHAFESSAAVEEALERLAGRELARRLERRPGEREARYEHLLGADDDDATAAATEVRPPEPVERPAAAGEPGDLEARVERLEREVRELREALGGP
jgi:hypothetical protein